MPTFKKAQEETEEPLPEGIDVGILDVFQHANVSDALSKALEHLHYAYKEGSHSFSLYRRWWSQ